MHINKKLVDEVANYVRRGGKLHTRLIAMDNRISRPKFHCNSLTTVQDIRNYVSLIFWGQSDVKSHQMCVVSLHVTKIWPHQKHATWYRPQIADFPLAMHDRVSGLNVHSVPWLINYKVVQKWTLHWQSHLLGCVTASLSTDSNCVQFLGSNLTDKSAAWHIQQNL